MDTKSEKGKAPVSSAALPQVATAPTFLFGMERSGTTLLSMLIGAHPRVAVPLATTGMWLEFAERLQGRFNDLATRDDVIRLVDAILAHERVKLWDAELDRQVLLADLPLGDFGAIVARFHEAYARAKGKPYWANVDIATLDNMDVVNAWFEDARFLHIIRDGRDVALSHQTMPYGAGNIAECARAWVHRTATNTKMGHILGPSRYMTVRFEDLVLDTQTTLARICAFIGVSYEEQMLRYAEMVEDKIPRGRRWLWPAISCPPQQSKVGRWRRQMTRSQRIVFEGVANRALKDWGYEAYDEVPRSAAAYLLDLWYYLIQGGRLRRLRRRLGFKRESLLERQARKLGERTSWPTT
ncbi:sulfotransferase family protein [Pelagibius marinus]|uniref:sulfotransferase family protein n=1 Tax=Pelagibius marinus TaxID=2762760 RepID=UPI001873357D|nr:sulfotransferase [Pelagibius marinus]